MGADMLDTTETDTLIGVHKNVALHALVSYDRVPLEMGRDKCQVKGVNRVFLTGPRPYESHHESRSFGAGFLVLPYGQVNAWVVSRRGCSGLIMLVASTTSWGTQPHDMQTRSTRVVKRKNSAGRRLLKWPRSRAKHSSQK